MMNKNLISLAILLCFSFQAFAELNIPAEQDFTDQGVAIPKGNAGSWDVRLEGMISPCDAIKIGSTFYIYYIGADGNRPTDNGPAHRKLGVATSSDGINFTKYDRNPILSYNPGGENCDEEGVFSTAVMEDDDGTILMYYSALFGCGGQVHGDIRLVTSTDGFTFSGDTLVIPYNSGCAGCGDELFPVSVFKSGGTYYLYYLTDDWDLYLARLSQKTTLISSELVLDDNFNILGGDGVMVFPDGEVIMQTMYFVGNAFYYDIRKDTAADPNDFTNIVDTWTFYPFGHMTMNADESIDTWFVYSYQGVDEDIHVLTAPFDPGSSNTRQETGRDGGGNCFIATAAFGSPMEPHVKILRQFRDHFLLTNYLGKNFVRFYYAHSPKIAAFITKHGHLRPVVRWVLLPFVGFSLLSIKFGLITAFVLFFSFLTIITAMMLSVRKIISLGKQTYLLKHSTIR